MDITLQKITYHNMGLIRKQTGIGIESRIDTWCKDFRKRSHGWSELAISRGEGNKLYPLYQGPLLLLDITEEPEIPDYILISYEKCLSNKKLEIWSVPVWKTPETFTQDLNRISGHIEGLESIIQYDVSGGIIWSIRLGDNKKWTLRYKK